MAELTDIKNGLASVLEGALDNVAVHRQPADSINHFPALVLLFLNQFDFPTLEGGMGSTLDTMQSEVSMVLFLKIGNTARSWEELDEYMSREGDKSVYAAMLGDRTWGGQVDDSWIISITNTGIQA